MSWLQAMKDEFTLRPFELQQTHTESAAMASEPPDVMANQEAAEESSGKKKSKFQTFKKFFARKKRKESSSSRADAELKASQSSDNISKTSENNTLTRSEKDRGSGSKISLGSKALSHDSVFVSDSSEANEALGASQDSIHGKVKSLQLQLKQAIRLGSPPSLMCVKRTEDAGTMSEDDGLPCSPPEYVSPHKALAQRNSLISLEGTDSDEDQMSGTASSRAVSPLVVVPGDFSQPASPFGCLDNSAAKHKLGLRHKACNKRKPANRVEIKAEEDSVVEEVLSVPFPASLEGQEEEKTKDESVEGVKPDMERKEEHEEEEEKEQSQHFRPSLLKDKENEESDEESEVEQDVSHGANASSPSEPYLPEQEAVDTRSLPSSRPSSRASSVDSHGTTPEPPAGQTDYILDLPGVSCETEDESNTILLQRGGDDGACELAEEESSFLQEILSSLKTPLTSCSLGVETVGLKVEEEEIEEEEEEGPEQEEPPVSYQDVPSGSLMYQATKEEEEEVATVSTGSPSSLEDDEGEQGEEEEEELVVERFSQDCYEDSLNEEEEGESEENLHLYPQKSEEQATGETGQSGGDEEEAEKEPEEEDWENTDEEEVKEEMEREVSPLEEESDSSEEMTEVSPDAADREGFSVSPSLEADEGADVVAGDETVSTSHQTPAEPDDQESTTAPDSQEASHQNSEDEGTNEVETVEEVTVIHTNLSAELNENTEPDQLDAEIYLHQENVEVLDLKRDQTEVNPTSLSELSPSTESPESDSGSPGDIVSDPATTKAHIKCLSPHGERVTFPSHLSPAAELSSSPAVETPEQNTEEQLADQVEEESLGEVSDSSEEVEVAPVPVEEADIQSSAGSDQSKLLFTIIPARQRSLTSADIKESPCLWSEGVVDVVAKEDSHVKPELANSAKVDLNNVRNPGSSAPQLQSDVSESPDKTRSSAAAAREESAEVNFNHPFGVRLRKTSALHLFSSEEENTEAGGETSSCKVESPQPISVKPSISQSISNKPALPKKPEVYGDSGIKSKRISDPVAVQAVSGGSDPPSWISVAKKKQMIYKENSLEEITVKKEGQDRKSSLPMYVCSAASREHGSKTGLTGKVSPLECKTSVSTEKDAVSPPAPVPPQLAQSQPLPSPVAPKPHVPPSKPPHQSAPSLRSLSPPPPVSVPQKSLYTNPSSLSKATTSSKTLPSQSASLAAGPFSSRIAPLQPGSRAPTLSGQTPSSQRGLPPPALPQDEPPWMALAKKKAKAWSEMPQIVQ